MPSLSHLLTEEIATFCRINMNKKRRIPIRSSEMGVLIYIVKHTNNDGVRPVDLSTYFGMQKSSISAIVSSLENQSYIKKIPSRDKRSHPLAPTPKGLNLVNETIEDYHKTSNKIIETLGEERCKDFINTMQTITQIIQDSEVS
ncbi:MAG: MarR family winged helix-turn-helix transcriptional regulator [Bacillota bacterium]